MTKRQTAVQKHELELEADAAAAAEQAPATDDAPTSVDEAETPATSKPSEAWPVVGGVLLGVLVLFVLFGGIALLATMSRNYTEISQYEYDQVATICEEQPAITPLAQKLLADDYLSEAEFREIKREALRLKLSSSQ